MKKVPREAYLLFLNSKGLTDAVRTRLKDKKRSIEEKTQELLPLLINIQNQFEAEHEETRIISQSIVDLIHASALRQKEIREALLEQICLRFR